MKNQHSPTVACGTWFDDNWITPYVRFTFEPTGGRAEICLTLYGPSDLKEPMLFDIRCGTRALATDLVLKPGKTLKWSKRILEPDGEPVSISIRANGTYVPASNDQRELAAVLSRCFLSSDQRMRGAA